MVTHKSIPLSTGESVSGAAARPLVYTMAADHTVTTANSTGLEIACSVKLTQLQ